MRLTDCEGTTLEELRRRLGVRMTKETVARVVANLIAMGLVVECPHHPGHFTIRDGQLTPEDIAAAE